MRIFIIVATLQTATKFGTRVQFSAPVAGGSARKPASPRSKALQNVFTTRRSFPVISFG
jgi:hypothetical protein